MKRGVYGVVLLKRFVYREVSKRFNSIGGRTNQFVYNIHRHQAGRSVESQRRRLHVGTHNFEVCTFFASRFTISQSGIAGRTLMQDSEEKE